MTLAFGDGVLVEGETFEYNTQLGYGTLKIKAAYNVQVKAKQPNATRPGYTLKCWKTGTMSQTTWTLELAEENYNFDTVLTGDLVLYSDWEEAASYTLTLNLNGVSATLDDNNYTPNQETNPTSYTRKYYADTEAFTLPSPRNTGNAKNREVRTTEIDGETWWVAKDVCDILDITVETTRRLEDDEKGLKKIQTPSGMQDMTVINESGLYTLLMRSNKEEAKPFRRWVTHEVLPTIRKTGSYNAKIAFDPMQGARAVFEAAGIKDNQLALAMDKVYRSYTGRSALEAGEIALTAPTKKQILTPTEIGKHFNMKAQRVNEILAGAGYQHKINDKWEALPPGEPYAVMQDVGKSHNNGTPIRQLKWDSSILSTFSKLIG